MLTSHAAKQYKLKQWVHMIQECKSSGLTVDDWCKQNELKRSNYYYRLKKVREAMLLAECRKEIVAIPDALTKQEPAIEKMQTMNGELKITIGDMSIHVNDSTPPTLLKMVLEVMYCAR